MFFGLILLGNSAVYVGSIMGGVFGFIDNRRNVSAEPILEAMASAMCHKEWYVVDKFAAPRGGTALGRVGINVFNPEKQPIPNEGGSLMIFMDGEIYDYADLRRELEDGRQNAQRVGYLDQ